MTSTTVLLDPTAPEAVQRLALDAREAAEALGISSRTLATWTDEGIIPVVEIRGRVLYPIDVLRDWLAERAVAKKRPGCFWICKGCRMEHDRRPERCQQCGSTNFGRRKRSLEESQASSDNGDHA